MKTFFRVSMLGLFMVVLTTVSFKAVMAQDANDDIEQKKALYQCYIDNYQGKTIPEREKALGCARDYVEKFPDDEQYVTYFKAQIDYQEKWITAEKKRLETKRLQDERNARFTRFDKAYTSAVNGSDAQKWGEVFSAGDAIISNDKDMELDAKIVLASAGAIYLAQANPPVDTYNGKTLNYLEDVISDINSGKSSKDWGAYNFKYKTKDNALGAMNELIGFIKYYRQSKKDEGVNYFYKATQFDSDAKKNASIYRAIGSWYLDTAFKIAKDRNTLLEQTTEMEKIKEPTDEQKATIDANYEKMKSMLAMFKGYTDRAIDAYARTYNLTKDVKDKDKVKELFNFRYSDPKEELLKSDANINSYVSSVNTKSMPNPATEVQPVKSEEDAPSDKPADATKKEEATTSGATRSRMVSKSDN